MHQRLVWDIHVEASVRDYILAVVRATREHPDLALGASTRGSLALYKSAQAYAAMDGREYVIPDDVKRLAVPTLSHRLILKPEAALRGRTAEGIITGILETAPLSLGAPVPA